MIKSFLTALIFCNVAACGSTWGDNASNCSNQVDLYSIDSGPGCRLARQLAIVASPNLVLDQQLLDRFSARIELAVASEPWLAKSQSSWGGFDTSSIWTKNSRVLESWAKGPIGSISSDADAALEAIGAQKFNFNADSLRFSYSNYYSPQILETTLAPYEVFVVKVPSVRDNYETKVTWSDGSLVGSDESTLTLEADIMFTTCYECFKHRRMRAIVTPTEATVFDLGGDDFPAEGSGISPSTVRISP